MKHMLILELDPPFNPNTADVVIKEYKDTIAFAKPDSSATVPLAGGDLNAEEEEVGGDSKSVYVPKIGDYVQWEPKGVLQFREPKRVTSLSADGKFAFVDGNGTGLPSSELTLHDKPVITDMVTLPPITISMRQDIFSLTEGTATIQWPTPLSEESIQDLKDWLKLVERKIARSVAEPTDTKTE